MGRTRESRGATKRMYREEADQRRESKQYRSRIQPRTEAAGRRADDIFDETADYYRGVINNPTVSAENIARMRGNGVFDEFARTGGWTEDEKGDYRARATRTVPAFYTALRNNLERMRAVNGGVDPGYDSQTAALARHQAQASQDAATDAETNLASSIRQGRMWGAGSVSDAEGRVVGANQADRGLNLEAMRGMSGLTSDALGQERFMEGLLQEAIRGDRQSRMMLMEMFNRYHPNQNWFQRNAELLRLLASMGQIGAGMLPSGGRGPGSGAPPGPGNEYGDY